MKKIETILEDLRTWVEEDSENRAIAVVAVQKKDETEDGYQSEQNHATVGVKQLLVDAFDTVMSDRDSDGLYGILRIVIRRKAVEGLGKLADRFLKNKSDNKGNKPENGSEEGKEADHE